MTDKPEHCYMCEHRADIGQGDFYCGLDEKNHCLLNADFPTDCPLHGRWFDRATVELIEDALDGCITMGVPEKDAKIQAALKALRGSK